MSTIFPSSPIHGRVPDPALYFDSVPTATTHHRHIGKLAQMVLALIIVGEVVVNVLAVNSVRLQLNLDLVYSAQYRSCKYITIISMVLKLRLK